MPVFLTPLAGLVALGCLLPLGAALLRERRLRTVRRTLRLEPPGRDAVRSAVAAAAALALLGLAAAQPAVAVRQSIAVRTDAQAYAVLDNSRSMEAVARRGGLSRLVRAKLLALRLRDALPQVPWGVASFDDRTLVHAFPTVDRQLYADTLGQTIGIGRPAPGTRQKTATDLAAVGPAAGGGFFDRRVRHRLLVLYTDGESVPFHAATLAAALRDAHVRLVVVRFWSLHDRVYDRRGRELSYRPDPASGPSLAALSRLGVPVVSGADPQAAVSAARRLLGSGPTAGRSAGRRLLPLAPVAALAALFPLGYAFLRTRR